MISLPLAAGLVVVAAAAVAVTLSDGRAVAAALFVALAVSPFATDPLPGTLEIAARLVAALLAAYVLWIVMKGGAVRSEGTAIGVVAELAVAAAAYTAGWWLEPVQPLQAPVAEQASGFALVALAVLPLAGSNVLRAGIGVMLIALGASFVMQTWLGPAPALAQLALTALLLAVPAALSLLVDPDDVVPPVVPAVEKTRPESEAQPTPAPVRRPVLEVEAPEPAVIQGEAAILEAGAADGAGGGTAAEAAEEAMPRLVDGAPVGSHDAAASGDMAAARASQAAHATARRVQGPAPSIRFLGGRTPVRRRGSASDSPAEPASGATGEASGAAAEASGAAAEASGAAAEADTGQVSPSDNGGRPVRDPRNPRYKRPLR
jgi:hypothetical protein